jgi:hypothetical protein
MSLDYRSRCDKNQGSLPSRPEPLQDHPEQLVRGGEPTPWSSGVKGQQLLTQRQILEHEILARAERVDDPADDVTKGGEHGRNVIAMLTLQPGYKSFILDAHNILITHSLTRASLISADPLIACT